VKRGFRMTVKAQPPPPRNRRLATLTTCVTIAVGCAAAAGCAAMKRTWEFNAAARASPAVQVTPRRIGVAPKSVYVRFCVRHTSPAPEVIEVGTFTLRLPDGTTVDGHTSMIGRGFEGARGLLVRAGVSAARPNAVPPGASVEVALNFRQYGRDLRRHPTLTVA